MELGYRRLLFCVLLVGMIPAALAEGVAVNQARAGDRNGLVQSGHASWLVQGGPLSPLEAEASRQGDGYILTVRGTYPIMDLTGKISEPATRIQFWAQRGEGEARKILDEQVQEGSWRPGDPFIATFKAAKSLIEGRDPAYLAICIGNGQSCWPSVNLAPP
jgi:hypothetical protein